MLKLVYIAIGGAFGSVLRYLVSGWVQRLTPGVFPIGTMVVNLSGCVVIGFLAALLTGPLVVREEYRVGLLVGVLGGYTTFSSFSLDTNRLADSGQFLSASANVLLSVGVGLAATWVGARVAQYLYSI